METQNITPQNEEKKKKVFTHGNTTVVISHISAAVIGGAIGAIIKGRSTDVKDEDIPGPKTDGSVTPPSTPDEDAEKKDQDNPSKESQADNPGEPKPTDTAETTDKTDGPVTGEVKTKDDKDVASNPEQEEIDKITEELINGSKIDDRDIADVGSMLEGSYPVVVSLENGLETIGYPFTDCGLDLVLLDLDGDGVYGDVFADLNGELMRFDMPVTLSDGRVLSYDELIASMHITESDIEQILNDDPHNDLTMTEDDRRRLEEDDPSGDIVNTDKPEEDNVDKEKPAALTDEEEDELLRDILGDNQKDEGEIDDSELDALLAGNFSTPGDDIENDQIPNGIEDTALTDFNIQD